MKILVFTCVVFWAACGLAGEIAPLSLELSPALTEAGWTVRAYEPPSKLPYADGAVLGFDFDNEKVTQTVLRKDGIEATVHASLSIWVYRKESFSALLKHWDELYDWQLANFERDLVSSPAMAVGPPTRPDALLFWRTNDCVLLLFEDEVGFPQSKFVKAEIKRQLLEK